MNRFLRVTALILGAITFFKGLGVRLTGLESYDIVMGGITMTVPLRNTLFYVIVINIIFALAIVYHSASTLEFEINSSLSLNKLQVLSGYITYLGCFFLFIEMIVSISGHFERFSLAWPFTLISLLIKLPLIIIPFMIVWKNFSINEKK